MGVYSFMTFSREKKWKKLEDLNREYLDSLDIIGNVVLAGRNLNDIIDDIEERFSDDPRMPEELHGFVFNFLGDDEIGEYLAKRYNLRLREEFIINYYLTE